MGFLRKLKSQKSKLKWVTGIANTHPTLNKVSRLKHQVQSTVSKMQGLPPHEKKNVNLEISDLPKNIEDFTALRDNFSKTPEGAAAIFLLAMNMYAENKELGLQALTISVDQFNVVDSEEEGSYKGKLIKRDLKNTVEQVMSKNPNVGRAYWAGANPDNGFTPDTPLLAKIIKQKGDEPIVNNYYRTKGLNLEQLRLFVISEATDSPRPITLITNTSGIWKMHTTGLIMGVQAETVTDDGDDL